MRELDIIIDSISVCDLLKPANLARSNTESFFFLNWERLSLAYLHCQYVRVSSERLVVYEVTRLKNLFLVETVASLF